MKRRIICIFLILGIALFISGCGRVITDFLMGIREAKMDCPESGTYYCEELNIYLAFGINEFCPLLVLPNGVGYTIGITTEGVLVCIGYEFTADFTWSPGDDFISTKVLTFCGDYELERRYLFVRQENDITTDPVMYTADQLAAIMQQNCALDEMLEKYPTNNIHQYGDNCYVIYFGDIPVVVMKYDKGEFVSSNKYIRSKDKSWYENLDYSMSLNEMRVLVPDGNYENLYEDGVEKYIVSVHYTLDRYIVFITYDFTTELVVDVQITAAWQGH